MNAQKRSAQPKKLELALLAGGGGIERMPKRTWVHMLFGFLFSKKSDLTLEAWRDLERKRGLYNREPVERNRPPHDHWR